MTPIDNRDKNTSFAEKFTADLLRRSKVENGYKCPKCKEIIESPLDFIQHMQKHLDDFLAGKEGI